MHKALETAFRLTDEEHNRTFERFVNAFLLDDYPELQALGGKKDLGMDARLFLDNSGQAVLIVQSCVSPSARARTKILETIEKLSKNEYPETFLYCTPAKIGVTLDTTRQELRKNIGIHLEVCDGEWFSQRAYVSANRQELSKRYSDDILSPLLKSMQPDRLYTELLSTKEESMAIQYLEAHALERSQGRNLTKLVFDSLISFVTRETEPPDRLLSEGQICVAIRDMFPPGHAPRINKIVPGRIKHLVKADILKAHTKDNAYALSHQHKTELHKLMTMASGREIEFVATLHTAVLSAATRQEIDYEYDAGALSRFGHACILWFLHEQGKRLKDGTGQLLNILNPEELVRAYISAKHNDTPIAQLNNAVTADILPHALYDVLNSNETSVRQYLRDKADLFITEAFLQASPDVQKACQKLFASDILYVDTTILIKALAEKFSADGDGPLLQTLQYTRKLGVPFYTFHAYVEELVSHLKGPVMMDWQNHGMNAGGLGFQGYLRTAPPLVKIFQAYAKQHAVSVNDAIASIIGTCNEVENAMEFLQEEFGITTQDLQGDMNSEMQSEREAIFAHWMEGKRMSVTMNPERFKTLVRNDVNAFMAMLQMRKMSRNSSPNYGHKVWLLTLDQMFWRIPNILGKSKDDLYRVAMGVDYLINYVATLSNIGMSPASHSTPSKLPVTLFSEVGLPSELREAVTKEYTKEGHKKYRVERRIRELVHELKSGSLFSGQDEMVEFIS